MQNGAFDPPGAYPKANPLGTPSARTVSAQHTLFLVLLLTNLHRFLIYAFHEQTLKKKNLPPEVHIGDLYFSLSQVE